MATIGFTKTTASGCFDRIRKSGIKKVVDVRLHNTSQLAGFAKADDLAYFLKEICGFPEGDMRGRLHTPAVIGDASCP